MIEQDQIKAIEWIIECAKKGADISQELIALAEKELSALLDSSPATIFSQADFDEIYNDDYFHAMELERGNTNLRFEDWEAEQMKDPEFRATAKELEPAYQAARMEYSKNERAGQLLGFRLSGTAVLEPSELGYRCPVCKNVPLLNHEYDERLTWSEYNSCLWCEVCNRDFPSCLCLEDIGQAIEVFLDSVETAAPHKDRVRMLEAEVHALSTILDSVLEEERRSEMLVLMTWYLDGSGDPSLYFFEENGTHNVEPPLFRLVPKLIEEIECGKKATVYKIRTVGKQPVLLFPKDSI